MTATETLQYDYDYVGVARTHTHTAFAHYDKLNKYQLRNPRDALHHGKWRNLKNDQVAITRPI